MQLVISLVPCGIQLSLWLRLLTGYKQQEKIRVGFFDPETASVRQTEMYVEGFKAKLKKDTSYKGLWIVSFTLKEL